MSFRPSLSRTLADLMNSIIGNKSSVLQLSAADKVVITQFAFLSDNRASKIVICVMYYAIYIHRYHVYVCYDIVGAIEPTISIYTLFCHTVVIK